MFRDNLKDIRNKKNISQRELGRRIDKTGQYISYLENTEDSNPSLDVISAIAKALGVSISDLTENAEIKTAKEKKERQDILKKLEIKNDTDSLPIDEKACILKSIDNLHDALIEFFISGAAAHNIENSSLNGEKITIKALNDFAKFLNVVSQLYKNSAHECTMNGLMASISSLQTYTFMNQTQDPIDNPGLADVEKKLNEAHDILDHTRSASKLKSCLINYLIYMGRNYAPKDELI
ncbi:helix-turn-helix domain-containing protein [Clostridium sp. WILCCON 0269]|uniref:Helix-turn-helix domain-containing protein n=1 Tax=Candidatus Clostridium eludens TaxID=3381663 RepID=A0ABW8SQR4_9CLOT